MLLVQIGYVVRPTCLIFCDLVLLTQPSSPVPPKKDCVDSCSQRQCILCVLFNWKFVFYQLYFVKIKI